MNIEMSLPNGSENYFEKELPNDLEKFINKATKNPNEKSFSGGAFYNSFKDFLQSRDSEMQGYSTIKKLTTTKTDPVARLKTSLKNLEREASQYDQTPFEDERKKYNKTGRAALYNFLTSAHEAGVSGRNLAESFTVLASMSGFDVKASDIKLTDFRAGASDFEDKAKEIVKKTVSLPELKVEEKELSDDEKLEKAANGAEGNRTKIDFDFKGAGINSKDFVLKNIENFIDNHGATPQPEKPSHISRRRNSMS